MKPCQQCQERPWECRCSARKGGPRFDPRADGTPFPPQERYAHAAHPYYEDNTPGD